MDLCPVAANHQSSKLDEFVLVSRRIRKAGRNAHASSPTVGKSSTTANDSFVFASPELHEAPSKLTSPLFGDAIGKEGRIASSFQAVSIAFHDHSRLQMQGKEAQASQARSDGDGETRRDPPQRSASPIAPLGVATKIRGSNSESSGVVRTHQVPPKGDSSDPRKSDFSSAPAGFERSSEDSETIAAKQTERIDLSAAKAKAPKARNSQRKNSSNSVITPSPHSLIEQPGTGTGATSLEGEAAQGPSSSPVDYSLEVEVDFPKRPSIDNEGKRGQKSKKNRYWKDFKGESNAKILVRLPQVTSPDTSCFDYSSHERILRDFV